MQNTIREIYSHLGDDFSKELYGYRLLYSTTGDYRYITKSVLMTEPGKRLYERLRGTRQKKVLFGAGYWGKALIDLFPDIEWECFADNKQEGQSFGMPVISFDNLRAGYKKELIVISTRLYQKEVYNQLLENGFEDENIINAGKIVGDMFREQYFDLPQLPHVEREVFVDVGSYDGMTTLEFERWNRNGGGGIFGAWVFEPDDKCYETCRRNLKGLEGRVELIKKGVWDREGVLSFRDSGTESVYGKVGSDGTIGEQRIEVTSLDQCLGKERVTFIKMDIEGSERKALEGSREIIRLQKPKLAISLYHKNEDVWEIPAILLELRPDYTLFLRHYSLNKNETVLYAI